MWAGWPLTPPGKARKCWKTAFRRRDHRKPHHRTLAHPRQLRHRPQHRLHLQSKSIDANEIGNELRVRYVLEGSVQRDQNRVRVTYSNLAAAYAQAGKMNEAKAALAEARSRNPELTVNWVKEHGPNFRLCSTASARRGCRRSEAT
jgi:hypothetical protein